MAFRRMVGEANRMVNESSPIVDVILRDGSRVNVVLGGISVDGSAVTIRKFSKEAMSMNKLMELGAIDEKTAGFLGLLVASGYNIFISGGTGAGKTTFMGALSEYIPSDERVITIEDSAELEDDSSELLDSISTPEEDASLLLDSIDELDEATLELLSSEEQLSMLDDDSADLELSSLLEDAIELEDRPTTVILPVAEVLLSRPVTAIV